MAHNFRWPAKMYFICAMGASEIWQIFVRDLKGTTSWEFIGVFAGIGSVYFSKKENILVYPIGLVNTIIYIFLSFKYHLFGEAVVNFYYTIMSIYGWMLWSKKNNEQELAVHITTSSKLEYVTHFLFFAGFYVAFYVSLNYLKQNFSPNAIPWADALASSTAFTGMWLMAKKKVESWWWWMATNATSIPLYFVKGLVFTSIQYVVLLCLAILGLVEWYKRAAKARVVLG